jgi:hypothetical protein
VKKQHGQPAEGILLWHHGRKSGQDILSHSTAVEFQNPVFIF